MKACILVLGLGLLMGPAASAQDSTQAAHRSARSPFRGIHFDIGLGAVPYLDPSATGKGAVELKIALPLRRFPDWSIALAISSILDTDTTSYALPAGASPGWVGFHPDLVSTVAALEMQRRWDQDRVFHPMATIALGGLMNTYSWYENGDLREYGKTWIAMGQVAGGAEVNVMRWLRANVLVGYRSGGRMKIEQANGSNGGMTTMFNLQVGRF